jgi:hypothetical protein
LKVFEEALEPTRASTTVSAATEVLIARATTRARELFPRTGFIYGKVASMQSLPVQSLSGILRFLVRRHGYEGEAAGPARHFILNQDSFADRAGLCEKVLKVVLCGVEGKIPDIKFGCHMSVFLLRRVSAAVSDHRISNRH